MSTTILYTITDSGDLDVREVYQNSHGWAAAVWTVLTAKYVPMGMPIGGTDGQRLRWIMEGRKNWLIDSEHCFSHMGPMSRDGRMSDHDALVYACTMDFAAVKLENLLVFAEAFEAFVAENPSTFMHIPLMAEQLRAIHAEGNVRGVCWNTTSLSDTFAAGIPDDDETGDYRPYNFDVDDRHVWVGPEYLRSESPPA